MKLYGEIAEWWPIFSHPGEYKGEAAFFRRLLKKSGGRPRTILDLGSGGGNIAFHLKRYFSMTLVDLSPGMLKVSRALNPECQHIRGDMRTVRLGRTFDGVFAHDAICHMTKKADLRAALKTAFAHCRPGGVALFVPDYTREIFVEEADHGGSDSDRGSVRFVQWVTDPNPRDRTYLVDFAILLRDARGRMRVVHDRHVYGLFSRAEWRSLLREVGFTRVKLIDDFYRREMFLAHRPAVH
jgi:SAM-dependent methyltransferase